MLGSVWLPVVFCLVMMAVCCGGPLLLGRWRRARHRPQQAPSAMLWMSAAGGGRKERLMAKARSGRQGRIAAATRPVGRRRARLARRLTVTLVLLMVGAGCSRGDRAAAPSQAVAEDPGVVHVHGLGINPRDGGLFAATHTGLFAIGVGTATRVTERLQDTMGFTVVGPDYFLGSGHPDFRDTQLYDPNKRPLLGLVESRDAGRSWQPLSLLGEADFHALQVAHGRVYGYDATGQRFMVTADRRRWQVRSTIQLVGFAVSPADPELVVATTGRRLLRSTDGGRQWQPLQGPALLVLDWADQAGLWGVAADGQVWHSPDAAKTWQRPGQVGGQPEALLADQGQLYAAVVELGIVSSADGGRSWQVRYREGQPAG
jgi:hypothetical protein